MRSWLLLCAALAWPAHADDVAPPAFDDWLATFRVEAAAEGISAATLDAAFVGAQPMQRVIELDRGQPEFLQTFTGYLGVRVTPARVAQGRERLAEHAALLDAVEAQYGVPKAVLVAFWGLETNYGSFKGNLNVPVSLATLAWEGRRSAFFEAQLLDALRIIDAGHVAAVDMNGSWAGAMGHMQFMPSTFRAYAVDGDGDGRIDLWESLPDAMYSAAHYLKRAGWRAGEPVAVGVQLPAGFDYRLSSPTLRMSVAEWARLGVAPAAGELPAGDLLARLILPQGWQGPAYLAFDNFAVVMRWNRSVNYALAVAELARQLAGGEAAAVPAGAADALSIDQVKALQRYLNELGYVAGEPDGVPGPRTQGAIRRFQAAHKLPVDGYPAPDVHARVEAAHAEAARAGKLTLSPVFADPEP